LIELSVQVAVLSICVSSGSVVTHFKVSSRFWKQMHTIFSWKSCSENYENWLTLNWVMMKRLWGVLYKSHSTTAVIAEDFFGQLWELHAKVTCFVVQIGH